MTQDFNNKSALVTGAGSGIGRAVAILLARQGAKVLVSDIDVAGGEETVSEIKNAGGEAVFHKADMANGADIAAMVDKAIETFGRLDCAVNNAGIAGQLGVAAADYPEDIFDKVIAVNLKGVWLCMKHEIKHMLEQGGGAIVNVSSAAGLIGLPNAAYTASKHGVVGLTKSAAVTYSRKNIQINSICPGYIETPIISNAAESTPGLREQLVAMHPIGRLGESDEIAEAIVWLCSDKASFMAGHALAVDGGLTAK